MVNLDLTAILRKLSPRVLSLGFIVAVFVLAFILAYAVYRGRSVDIWGFKIDGDHPPPVRSEQGTCDATCPDQLRALLSEVSSLRQANASAITIADLPTVWTDDVHKADLVRRLVDPCAGSDERCAQQDAAECLFAKMANRIGQSGGFVDLATCDKPTVQLVQRCLQTVSAYDGPLDGDAPRTRRALVSFQKRHGIRSDANLYEGKVGLKTLQRMREDHKAIAEPI